MTKKIKENSEKKDVLEVKRNSKKVLLPEYALETDIGLDLRSNEDTTLKPMEQKIIKTGLKIKIPEGSVGLIRDRAGIVSEMNVHTAAGTFDPAYRGEISIALINFGDEDVMIEKGMKIAQLIILPVKKMKIVDVKNLDKTLRGEKSFGSTGNN